jgi:ATP-dependent DNA helicase PIF1
MKKDISKIQIIAKSKGRRERMIGTDVLIIDEISMFESNQFRRLDRACRAARDSRLPFGRIQVVVTGDFYQLPLVKPFQTCYLCGADLKVRKVC